MHTWTVILSIWFLATWSLCGCDHASSIADSGDHDHSTAADFGGLDAPFVPFDAGSTADGPPADQSPPDSAQDPCAATITISSKADLLQVVNTLSWTSSSPIAYGFVPISAPLSIAGSVSLTSSDLTVPPNCAAANDCLKQVLFAGGFSAGGTPAGVSFSTKSTKVPILAYEEVTIAGTEIRLRAVRENIHPFNYNFVPVLKVEPGCQTSCPDTSQLCDKDKLCYGESQHCRICLGKGHLACACQEKFQPLPDGAACSYLAKTMSAICNGTCQSGLCVYSGAPDVYCP